MDIKACAAGFCCAVVYQNIGVFYPTGNGIDWGVHLARMGVSVSAVSVVGKDEYGDKMREALAAEGFDISHLRVEDGDTSVMLMALKDGVDRVHLEVSWKRTGQTMVTGHLSWSTMSSIPTYLETA